MIINFDPNTVQNFSNFFNEKIQQNLDKDFIMFIFNDIYEAVKDMNYFYQSYVNLLKRFDLPYAMYPYYLHFNKVLLSFHAQPSAKMRFRINGADAFDVVNQTSYGMFIIDVNKIKSFNFKFSPEYGKCFYIQELIEECKNRNLYSSNCWFLDVPKSYQQVTLNLKDGFKIGKDEFANQKTKFFEKYQMANENPQDFINRMTEFCKQIKEKEAGNFQAASEPTISVINTELVNP